MSPFKLAPIHLGQKQLARPVARRRVLHSLLEIKEAFVEAQSYVDHGRIPEVSGALSRAKDASLDACHDHNEKRKMQTLIVDYYNAP